MKKIVLVLVSINLFFSCKKVTESCLCPKPNTNYFVLTTINQVTFKKTQDNYYFELHENDTCNYLDYFVNINLAGYVVSIDPTPPLYGQKNYFINVLKEINISTNTTYNNPEKFYYRLYRNIDEVNFPESMGYSPFELYLTQPPDTTKLFYFNIELIDDEEHHFKTTTTPVYITK